ncbi:GNAT family N-acetyltransferase [Streptomyces armeniacus]|uniref:GNAT family N-acetyltransferase n=2 Tax=Streptomyces armeniacus TaxID=83291 RepID=A0A345XZC0_9ACTN|nr:GNAT family N-acetyltransferase [Streptomyces armeniacus]
MAEADIDAVAELRVRGWQHAYAGLMPQTYLDGMSPDRDAGQRRELFAKTRGVITNLVAEDDAGRVTGWAALGPYRDDDRTGGAGRAQDGELYALYVLPERIGTGTGRALMDAVLTRAEELGHTRLLLWVVKGNARARRFYERAGWAPDGAEEAYDVDGASVPELRYVRGVRRVPEQRSLAGANGHAAAREADRQDADRQEAAPRRR